MARTSRLARYFQHPAELEKLVPEGVEGACPTKHHHSIIHQLAGGLRAAMGYNGSTSIDAMRKNHEVRAVSPVPACARATCTSADHQGSA